VSTTVQELRRIADSLNRLRDKTIQQVVVRSDCKQMRLTLDDGQILLVSILTEDNGKPRLDVDVVYAEAVNLRQLEVRFDEAASDT
jgi:hypothetical protein